MAAPEFRNIRTQLTSVTECSVCRQTFSDPRQLPCIHTYCLKCIDGCCRGKISGDEVPCPICRKNFSIPPGGVGRLPKNFFMQQLIDISLASPLNTRCQGCSVDGSEQANAKSAIMFCVECSQLLCESCVYHHRRVSATRTHELVQLNEDIESIEAVLKSRTIYCDEHTHKPLEVYCFDCKKATCLLCYFELHKTHECTDVKKVAGEFKKLMTGDIKNMLETVVTCRKLMKWATDYQNELVCKLDVIEKEICDRVDQVKQLIDTEKANLLKELSAVGTERNMQMNNVISLIEHHVLSVESTVVHTKQLMDMGSAIDVVQQTNALHIRAEELMKLDDIHQTITNSDYGDITLTPVNRPSQFADSTIVGQIHKESQYVSKDVILQYCEYSADTPHVTSCGQEDNQGRPSDDQSATEIVPEIVVSGQQQYAVAQFDYQAVDEDELTFNLGDIITDLEFINTEWWAGTCKGKRGLFPSKYVDLKSEMPTLKHVIPADGRAVIALTFINNELFVLRSPSNGEIQVYETALFKQKRTVHVAGLKDGDDEYLEKTLCGVKGLLLVCDLVRVYTVELSTGNVINWRVDGSPTGLSVNHARHVIVTCYHGREIREYIPKYGLLIRTIKLHVTSPCHAVQLTDSRFIVSHLGPEQGVSLIDAQGICIATCRISNATTEMNWTIQVTVMKNGSILLVDCINNRLVVLDARLRNARDLPLPTIDDGLDRPNCFYLDESLSRLYVGELYGGRVVICGNISSKRITN